jgi:hypothetical protein
MAVRRASAFHYSVRLPQNFYLKHLIYNKEGTLLRRKLLLSGVVLSVLLCSSLVVSVEAASMWSRTYGGTADEKAYSLVATSDGGYAIAGIWNYSYYSNWFTSYSWGDFWLVKIDEFGDMQWNRTYGGTYKDEARSLIATPDGGYAIAGIWNYSYYSNWFTSYSWGDFWLVKTDALGNMEWNRTYDREGENLAYSVVATPDGGYAIAGYTNSWTDFVSNADVWLLKTDAFGNMEWNRTYGGTGDDWANSLVATSDGGYVIAGIWNCTLADRRFYDDGYDGGDFWLIKTDALGNVQWNHTYGGIGSDWANSLIVAPEGGYIMAGFTTNSFGIGEYWLVKTDEGGNMQWNKTYGGFGEEACSVIATPDGGYAIVGDDGVWLVKTDEFGNKEWWARYGGMEACSIIATPDGGYAIAGATVSDGDFDCWFIKTDEFGVVPEYSSWLVPALVLTATAFIIINKKRLIRTR